MKKIILLLTCLLFLCSCFSQVMINRSRHGVRKAIERHLEKSKMSASISESDSTIILTVTDSNFKPATFIHYFNKQNRSIKERSIACDSCVAGYLQNALKLHYYKWKKIRPNYYVSSFFWKLSMEVVSANGQSELVVQRMKWKKGEYDTLLAQVE